MTHRLVNSNRSTVASAVVIPKLRLLWTEDVRFLGKMLANREQDSEVHPFIKSLQTAKKSLLGMLPYGNAALQEVPSPAKRIGLSVAKSNLQRLSADKVKLPKIFCQIEKDQFAMLQKAISTPGVPDGIATLLEEITATHQKIVDQLSRITKTQQLQPIVLR